MDDSYIRKMPVRNLINRICAIRSSKKAKEIDTRLKEFLDFNDKGNESWFSEMCFCILTANSKAKTACNIQNELDCEGFYTESEESIRSCIIRNKHRFHNNKARFIIEARKYHNIKDIIIKLIDDGGTVGTREWLVQNIKGLGYKEASHFLRNIGYQNVSILDRHILRLMYEYSLIEEIPKHLSKKTYLDIEKKFKDLAAKAKMNLAELDLYMWYMRTGEVLK
jgi:N-glycosylase/DNA lyase